MQPKYNNNCFFNHYWEILPEVLVQTKLARLARLLRAIFSVQVKNSYYCTCEKLIIEKLYKLYNYIKRILNCVKRDQKEILNC